VFLVLEQAKRIQKLEARSTQTEALSTPSGMIPPYQKPKVAGRKQKPGRKPGHEGARRESPHRIDRNRGDPALKQFFHETFAGTLVTDFWAAYDRVRCSHHQYCLAHLLRELTQLDQRKTAEEWHDFSKKTHRLFQDALRLRARDDFSPETYASRIHRFYERLLDLAVAEYSDADAHRLARRLEKYWDELFTFLEHPEVPATNNQAEREIRFAVLIRKIIYGNRSHQGAFTQSVLMTILRTLKRRGYNPIDTLVSALREFVLTGHLPPFPPPNPSDR